MATFTPQDPAARLAKLRQAKSEGVYSKVRMDGSTVDGMSAGYILDVYAGLNETNKERLLAMPYTRMQSTLMRLMDKGVVGFKVGASRTKSRTKRRAGQR